MDIRLRNFLKSMYDSVPAKALAVFLVVLAAGVTGFYLLELRPTDRGGVFDALWWAAVTLTTVGYGDVVPTTTAGKALGMVVMASGIGLVAALTGNMASVLVERKVKKRKGMLKVNVAGHFIVLGWNVHAPVLIKSLTTGDAPDDAVVVCVNTLSPEEFTEHTSELGLGAGLRYVRGNPAREQIQRRASPGEARQAYILSRDGLPPDEADQQSIFTALAFKGLAPKVPLFAETSLAPNRPHLLRAGVDEVICRGELSSQVLGTMGAHPVLWRLLRTLVGDDGGQALSFRNLSGEERAMTWKELVLRVLERDRVLPLAVCRLKRDITLEELLDQDSALDNYILQLFNTFGRETTLGERSPSVAVNPDLDAELTDYDAFVFLKQRCGPA